MKRAKPVQVWLFLNYINRQLKYNDSIWAWKQLDKTIKQEILIDGWNGEPTDNK